MAANCSPTPSTDKEGATAIIRSYCKADLSKLATGAALDIKLLPSSVETCGYADTDVLLAALPFVDLFLWDIKDTDDKRHKQYTGVSNKKILDNLAAADANGAKIRLRCILVNGINTDDEHYRGIAKIASSLSNCEGVELIPYHAYAGTKSVFVGREDSGRKEWIPEVEQLERARLILKERGICVI